MDLKLGETCTALYKFISAGTAHTFRMPFDADKVVFTNLTKFGGVQGYKPQSIWYKDGLAEPYALQYQTIDSATGGSSFSSLNTTTNGFTSLETDAHAPEYRANISAVSAVNPVRITTSAPKDFQTSQIVRITDLGNDMPTNRGASYLNNQRFLIVVIDSTHFDLYDPVTGLPIDGTGKEAYVTGGRVDLESRVISLNNPQQPPYQLPNAPYIPTPFVYNAATFDITAGTAVMGSDGDEFRIEYYKFGQVVDLGDLLT